MNFRPLDLVIVSPFIILLLPREIVFYPLLFSYPLVLVVLLITHSGLQFNGRAFTGLYFIFTTSLVVVFLSESKPLNLALSLATYSGFYILLAEHRDYNERSLRSWIAGLLILSMTQALIGTYQLLQAGFPFQLPYVHYSPDIVQGTYGPGGVRILTSVSIYALFLCINMLSEMRERKYYLYIGLLSIGVILPGANGAILSGAFAMAAYVIYVALRALHSRAILTSQMKRLLKYIPLVLILMVFLFSNFGSASHVSFWLTRLNPASNDVTSPKTKTALATLFQLPQDVPYQPIFGLGLGNYSSWSQLLLSGIYVETRIVGKHMSSDPGLPTSYRRAAWDYVLKYLSLTKGTSKGTGGNPFFSWQSLYAEIGILGIVILLLILWPRVASTFRYYEGEPSLLRIVKRTLAMSTLFLFALCFTDNFLEYPWMTVPYFVGLILLPSPNSG